MKRNIFCKGLLAFVLSVTLFGCGSSDGDVDNPFAGTDSDDTIVVNLAIEPPAINGIMNADNISGVILTMSMSGLVARNGDGEIEPAIAKKWDVSEDKKTYTFHLRDDAKWTNDEKVTANDFVFAWRTIMNPSTASAVAGEIYPFIKNGEAFYKGEVAAEEVGVKAIDDYTLEVQLQEANPAFVDTLYANKYLPMNQKAYESIGADAYGTDADKMVVNGAYKVKEWTHDDHITMEKNEAFYASDEVAVPFVKYVMISDSNAAMNAFKAGEIDVLDIIGDQISDLESQGSDVVKKYYDNGAFVLQFNMQRPATSNSKINRALVMAIDMESLCNEVFKDGSMPATGVISPTLPSATEGKSYGEMRGDFISYDVKEAKKLFAEGLKELGITAEEYALTYSANDSVIGRLQGEYFKDQWKKNLGIDVTIELTPFAARYEKLMAQDFDVSFNGWSGGETPKAYIDFMIAGNENNFGLYNNPAFDELIAKATKETDLIKREEYVVEAEKMLIEDGAMVPLYHTCIVYASSKKVEGMISDAYQKYNFTKGAKIRK